MKFKRVPLWRDAMQLLVELEQIVKHFPQYHKYTLGTELRQQAMKIVRLIQRSFLDKSQITRHLQQLVFAIDDIKLQLFLAKELKIFRDFSEFERLSDLTIAIGRQANGWKKAKDPVGSV